MTIENPPFTISTDPALLDIPAIHKFLSEEAYWCLNIPFQIVKRSIEHSLNFGVYHSGKQIGFARIISDFSTIAYLGDVYILAEFRGQGLSKWLIETVRNHPDLQGLRRWILLTGDAHELYRRYGFTDIPNPEVWMEIHTKNMYQQPL